MTKYLFRREDNDALIEVDFQAMIQQDALGAITLPDGVTARRCRHLEQPVTVAPPKEGAAVGLEKPIVSDSLGFTYHQLAAFEADRVQHGFSGVEFRPDPLVPGFYQAHFSGRAEWERYYRHRGYGDRNSLLGSAPALSQADLDRAADLVNRDLADRASCGNK